MKGQIAAIAVGFVVGIFNVWALELNLVVQNSFRMHLEICVSHDSLRTVLFALNDETKQTVFLSLCKHICKEGALPDYFNLSSH